MTIQFKACPKCRGDITDGVDNEGIRYQNCVQCGFYGDNGLRLPQLGADTLRIRADMGDMLARIFEGEQVWTWRGIVGIKGRGHGESAEIQVTYIVEQRKQRNYRTRAVARAVSVKGWPYHIWAATNVQPVRRISKEFRLEHGMPLAGLAEVVEAYAPKIGRPIW